MNSLCGLRADRADFFYFVRNKVEQTEELDSELIKTF